MLVFVQYFVPVKLAQRTLVFLAVVPLAIVVVLAKVVVLCFALRQVWFVLRLELSI